MISKNIISKYLLCKFPIYLTLRMECKSKASSSCGGLPPLLLFVEDAMWELELKLGS